MLLSAIVPDRYPKAIHLADGTEVLLRPLRSQDEKALLDFFRKIPGPDRLFFRDDVSQPPVVRAWCKKIDFEKTFPLLAWVKDRIAADGSLHQDNYGWMRHVGEIRVSVDPEFRGRGIATHLVSELVRLAQDVGLEKIDARFAGDQKTSRTPFERAGFAPAAVLPRHMRDLEGKDHDLVLLVRDLLQAEYFAGD